MEEVLAFAGEYSIDKGINSLIVAGGETSGAVVKNLNHNVFMSERLLAQECLC